MRDPARIDRILQILGRHWKGQPDTRLGQLIVNLLPPNKVDVFYVEDDEIERRLREATKTK